MKKNDFKSNFEVKQETLNVIKNNIISQLL